MSESVRGACLGLVLALGCNHQPKPVEKTRSLSEVIESYGFAELRPPTRLLDPGTVVYSLGEEPFRVGIACTQTASLGEGLALRSSEAAAAQIASDLSRDFEIAPDFLKFIKASVQVEAIRQINIRLGNVRVHELPLDVAFDRKGERSEGCSMALASMVEASQPVSMITSVLEADVEYTVEFDSSYSAGAEARAEALQGIGLQLGGKRGEGGDSKIIGQGLYWGVRDIKAAALLQGDPEGIRDAGSEALIPKAPVAVDPTPLVE